MQRNRSHTQQKIQLLIIGILTIAMIILSFKIYEANGTGFDKYESISTTISTVKNTGSLPTTTTTTDNIQRGKTLWDLMQLLIIPIALAIIAIWFNRAEKRNDQEIATDNQIEGSLQSYLDRMSDLLLEKNLRASQLNDEVRNVARARTLTVLPKLDDSRKRSVIQFLYESNLITIIDLSEASLRGASLMDANLRRANFSGADLRETNLSGADLMDANFSETNLQGANFKKTNLQRINLTSAKLIGTDLSGVDLTDANLTFANLTFAKLLGVNLNRANLSNAKLTAINLSRANLNGVILTDTSFQGANLSEADLSNVDFTETKLTFPEMYKTPIQLAKYPILYFLDQAIFKIGVFILLKFPIAFRFAYKLPGAQNFFPNFRKAKFVKANLSTVSLNMVILNEADFSEANLSETDFRGAILQKNNFQKANLGRANLRGANLRGADLTGADLTEIKI